ncbi:hypothetical protein HIM_07682 [Hirsutella minnesotensis 3608]|uniref:Uncharacterized protein n=1 Tax=Hirsutella minnesotensis 3608 TaxID=1043627 RepID=A0A0F8A441_9HYPO|nr:hypothetical protein HIM_07682 [Hirsutella minnesotensis 3608]
MKFLAMMLAVVTALLSMASASPLAKRELGGVRLCTGPNATGKCSYKVYEMNKCHQLRAPFYGNTSTFETDGEPFACFPRLTDCGGMCRSPTGCTFGAVDFTYEHKYNLAEIQWNTLIKSFDCMPTRRT